MSKHIDYTVFPKKSELKEIYEIVEASGNSRYDFDYWFTDIKWTPQGGFSCKSGNRYLVAVWATRF